MTHETGDAIHPGGALPTPGEVVIHDMLCIRCGYNLRTLQRTARCPECGTLVADSWTPAPPLLWADKTWLATIRRGMSLILLTLLFGAIFTIAMMIGVIAWGITNAMATPGMTPSPVMPGWLTLTMAIPSLVLSAFGLYATFQATSPEPVVTADHTDPPARRRCRWALVLWFILSILNSVTAYVAPIDPMAPPDWGILSITAMVVGVLTPVLLVVIWGCLMSFWRTLAVRAADRSLTRQSKALLRCGIVVSCLAVLAMVGAQVMSRFQTQPTAAAAGSGMTLSTGPLSSLGYVSATTLPTTTAATTLPATMPSVPPLRGALIATMVFGCFMALTALVSLILGIWWIILIFRYRSMLQRVVEAGVDACQPLQPAP